MLSRPIVKYCELAYAKLTNRNCRPNNRENRSPPHTSDSDLLQRRWRSTYCWTSCSSIATDRTSDMNRLP